MVLHLRAEVPYARAVEVLDLRQGGAGNDVAAVVEIPLLLWTVFHLGQRTWERMCDGGRERQRGRRLRTCGKFTKHRAELKIELGGLVPVKQRH